MRGRVSPAMVVACVALFFSLGGVGYAAANHWRITSIHQIKPSVRRALKAKPVKPTVVPVEEVPGGTIDLTAPTTNGAVVSYASCPTHWHAVSGGGWTSGTAGLTVSQMGDDQQSWMVETPPADAGQIQALVYCSPGSPPSINFEASHRHPASRRPLN